MKKIEIFFRRLLLKLLLLLKKENQHPPIEKFYPNSRILFVRLNRIGDALVTTPLLKFIKKEVGCKISVLTSKSNYFIFSNALLGDEVIVYDKKKNGLFSLIKLLNSKNFDAVVDLHDDVSTTVSYLIAFSNSKYKFGLEKGTDKLYSHTIKRLNPEKHHVIERVMAFTELFGLINDPHENNIVFEPSEKSFVASREFLQKYFPKEKFLLGINISAGSEARFWGTDNYRELISSINEYDVNILLMCTGTDLSKAEKISNSSLPIFHNPEFENFSAMISNLNLLFTPDTSIVHIGSAFQIPVFGLYVKYNTQDIIWSPYKSVFDCIITREPTLKNVKLETVKEKFFPFFEKLYYEYSIKSDG